MVVVEVVEVMVFFLGGSCGFFLGSGSIFGRCGGSGVWLGLLFI